MNKQTKSSLLTVAKIQQILAYDPDQGTVKSRKTGRIVLPHPTSSSVEVYDPDSKAKRKFTYKDLGYTLAFGQEVRDDFKVLCLDLDETNIRRYNLKAIPNEDFKALKIALRNKDGELKITQHPDDKHAYSVKWVDFDTGLRKSKVFYEISSADAFVSEKMLDSVKIINKYIRSL